MDDYRIYCELDKLNDKVEDLNAKADTVIGLLRDIRDLLALQQTAGNTFSRSPAVVGAARVEGQQIPDRT